MRDAHQQALIDAAEARGIAWIDLEPSWGSDAVIFRGARREALVRHGRSYPELTSHAEFICDQKHVTKAVLRELGLPTPRGILIANAENERPAIASFLAQHAPAVCKPCRGTHGRGVAFEMQSDEQVVAHCRSLAGSAPKFVLEEQIAGPDLRIQVVAGELYAACVREPASVVGDGLRSIRQLAEQRDAEIQRQNPRNRMPLGDEARACLAAAGLDADQIPASGRRVVLARVPSIATGGRARDVTDELHPIYRDWCRTIARRIGLGVFAIDLIAAAPSSDEAVIIELNARSEWLHHSFSDGRQHDVAGAILEYLLA